MKEAYELLEILDRVGKSYDLPTDMADKAQALRLALECEPDNCIIVRYSGFETVYMIDEETSENPEHDKIPMVVRQHGLLRGLRHILEVPETQSILTTAVNKMRELRRLHARWCDELEQQNQLHNRGGTDRGER